MKPTRQQVCALAAQFAPNGVSQPPVPFGSGHINDTFVYASGQNRTAQKHILQRINRTAFQHPEDVMDNILKVTEHLRQKLIERGGDPARETLWLDLTAQGQPYVIDDEGEWWRSYRFVDNTISYDATDDPHIMREAGHCFGRFQDMLSDFDASRLHETIWRFHHMPRRFEDFKRAVANDLSGRAHTCLKEIEGALGYEGFTPYLQTRQESGELPLRVTHNDTKLNNILMDKDTGKGICAIDLDTVMPGVAAYDFGDTIRSGASTALEDEPDVDKVRLNMALYRAFTQGYLSEFGHNLSRAEMISLPMGARLMTMECLMRTLGDYIDGDIYYKTDYPEHNLVRARTQLKLMREMDAHWDEMNDIVMTIGKEAKA